MKKTFLLLAVLFTINKRMNAQTGQLDPTFGRNGIAKIDMGAPFDYNSFANQVLLGTNGSFYLVLNSTIITKRLPGGAIDSSYGIEGYSRAVALSAPHAALQADSKIVIAGTTGNYNLTIGLQRGVRSAKGHSP